MMRRIYTFLFGLALVTAGSAAFFRGLLSGWPATPLEWTATVLLLAWGSILLSVGAEILLLAGDPE